MKNSQKPTENPAETSDADQRGGRPTREEAERRRILAAGVDPALVDPRRILAAIALDGDTPATARVQACKALIATGAGPGLIPGVPLVEEPDDEAADELTRRALALMGRKQGSLPN